MIQDHRKLTEIFLGAIDLPEEKRAEYLSSRCGNDLEMRRKVEEMLAVHADSGSLLDKPVFEKALGLLPTETGLRTETAETNSIDPNLLGGKYRITETIGRGGMGIVYKALREDIPQSRPVAVKVLSPNVNDSSFVQRFHNEYKILASLEHPRIARLYDVGSTHRDLPYFVMELVEGKAIDEYCNNNQISTKEKLKLFLEVCSAVEYAHQNNIVHRDIKPSNVLVTNDGTPKLLDFGIAKIIKEDEKYKSVEMTMTGKQLMTPAYASPEQVQGKQVTPSVDVYALGVLLYKLLTGKLPYIFNAVTLEDIKWVICNQDPIKPSESAGSTEKTGRIDSDIDNIVLKSLYKEPLIRYHSVKDFADDIERYLNGFPILARRPSLIYRFQRFVKRNSVPLVATFVVLTLVGVIGYSIWRVDAANNEVRRAEEENQKNQQRQKQLSDLMSRFLIESNEELGYLPDSVARREALIKDAKAFMNSLPEDSSSLIDKAKILREIGKSLGRPRSSSSGDSQGALKSYEKSLEMLKQAAANNPSDERALLELASTYDLLGEMYEQAGEFQQAMNYYTDSMSIRQKLAKIDLLGSSYTKIGDIRESRENWVGASKMFKRNLEIKKEALSKDPKNLKLKQQACTVYTRIAEFMAKLGELYQEIDEDFAVKFFEKAIIYNQKMIDIVRESVATEPKNPSYERYMAGCLLQQGAVVFKTGKYAESRLHLSKALEIFEKHAKNDEQNIDLKWKLARNYGYFGESLLEAGQLDKAIVFLNRSVSILSDCVKRDSANRWFREDIEQFHYFLVIGYLRKNDPSALSAMQAFLQMYKDTSYVIPPETNHTLEFLRKTRGLYKEIYRKKLDSHLLDILKESFYWYKQNVSMKRKLEQVEYAFTLLTLEGKEAKEQEVLSIIKGCEKSLKQKDVIAQFRLSQIYSLLGEKEHGKKIYKTVHALLEKELEGI